MTTHSDVARKRSAQVVDSTAVETPLRHERPIRVSRPTFDSRGVFLMLVLLIAVAAFAGLIVNLTTTL